MKIFLVLIIFINLYGLDLQERILKLIVMPQKNTIYNVKFDPFQNGKEIISKVIEEKEQSNALSIITILNGRVFMNSKWYKVGDEINNYKIIQIARNSILVNNNGKIEKFGILKSSKLLQIRNIKQ